MNGQSAPDALKVLIYATSRGRLLVFDEPDFPAVELQVPGGTIEPGENSLAAARREFAEETGLQLPQPFVPIQTEDYRFARDGATVWHRRFYFHVEITGSVPETWIHREMTPFGGGSPIRFRFFWMPVGDAVEKLGYGMERAINLLPQ